MVVLVRLYSCTLYPTGFPRLISAWLDEPSIIALYWSSCGIWSRLFASSFSEIKIKAWWFSHMNMSVLFIRTGLIAKPSHTFLCFSTPIYKCRYVTLTPSTLDWLAEVLVTVIVNSTAEIKFSMFKLVELKVEVFTTKNSSHISCFSSGIGLMMLWIIVSF